MQIKAISSISSQNQSLARNAIVDPSKSAASTRTGTLSGDE